MGLLYEYSKPDERTYQVPPQAQEVEDGLTSANAEAIALPEIAIPTEEINKPSTDTTNPIRTVDVFVAGLAAFMSFCTMIFMVALFLTPAIPADAPALEEPLNLNVESILAAYEAEIIALVGFGGLMVSLGLLAGVGYMWLRTGRDWGVLGVRRIPPEALSFAVTGGIGAALGIRGGTLAGDWLAGSLADNQALLSGFLDGTSMPVLVVAFFLWITVVPFAQEVFFRGVVYTWVRQYRQPFGAMLISAIISAFFGLYLLNFFSSVLLAIGLALIYERTKSVVASYFAHSTFNFVSVIIYFAFISLGG
jgi:membrane protease YdiL (CAAX protease family)